jgi:hypothetical protein
MYDKLEMLYKDLLYSIVGEGEEGMDRVQIV